MARLRALSTISLYSNARDCLRKFLIDVYAMRRHRLMERSGGGSRLCSTRLEALPINNLQCIAVSQTTAGSASGAQ